MLHKLRGYKHMDANEVRLPFRHRRLFKSAISMLAFLLHSSVKQDVAAMKVVARAEYCIKCSQLWSTPSNTGRLRLVL